MDGVEAFEVGKIWSVVDDVQIGRRIPGSTGANLAGWITCAISLSIHHASKKGSLALLIDEP